MLVLRPPPSTAHPHHNKTQTKATANTSTPSSMGTKSRKTTGGAPHKGAARPRPSPFFCAKEWRGPGAAAVGCTGHLRRSLSPKTKSGAVSVCRLQGCREEEEEEEGCIQNERHTLPDQRGADSPFILQISSTGGRGKGWGGEGLKVKEEAFKVDVSHISHSTKESQRSAIWTQAHHLFRSHSKEIQPQPMAARAPHPALPSDGTSLLSDWPQRCCH